jgi:oxygen-independent coproporphyrinogen-3 oxidase
MDPMPSALPTGDPVPTDGALPGSALAGVGTRPFGIYVHVPFCTVRCGFCNLFTSHGSLEPRMDAYLDALELQMRMVAQALGAGARFSRLAIGGGTPTALPPAGLERVLSALERVFAVTPHALPSSVETSPETADAERLRVLQRWGVTRVSIGVQSFDERDCAALGRPQAPAQAHAALERIVAAGFATLNVDLIYGADGQTVASFLASIEQALRYAPAELYLYPLYVRELTGLGRRALRGPDPQPQLVSQPASEPGPSYCCQRDGMVGLGAGARSYTSRLHYAMPFAVAQPAVRSIIDAYCANTAEQHAGIAHGFALDGDERRRRFAILGLLQCDGLALDRYRAAFGSDARSDLPALRELEALQLAAVAGERLVLGERGVAYSDVIGPWLASAAVQHKMESYACR